MAKEEKKSMADVAKPGSTSPDTSSKPVIISNRPMVKDPMVNEETSDSVIDNKDENVTADSPSKGRVIKPISDNHDSVKEEAQPEKEKKEESSDEAVVDAVVSQATDKNKKARETEENEARRAANDKLIESKKYFVKVKAPKAKRHKRTALALLLVVFIGLMGVGAAADAELIGLSVPFDFIKKTQPVTASVPTPVTKQTTDEELKTKTASSQYIVPEGYIVYENKDAGFKFAYPEGWKGDLKKIDLTGTTDANSAQIDSYFVTPNPTEQVLPGVRAPITVITYKTATATIISRKYGPDVQIKDQKLIVTGLNEADTVNKTIGSEYKTRDGKVVAPSKQGNLSVFSLVASDEGCTYTHLIFIVKDKLHELMLPEFCDNSFGATNQPIIDPAKYNDLIKKITGSVIDVN